MELVVHFREPETLAAALDQGAGGVAVHLPRNPDGQVFSQLADWREAARRRGLRFYLIWDWLIPEPELPRLAEMLAGVARLGPDGLQLRDLGLVREARRRYPHLPLQAAANWGVHNTPGVKLAASLGFTRVVMEGPISLKDLALVRRQTSMPLAVTLPPCCPAYASLCLLEEYRGISCEACCQSRPEIFSSGILLAALDTFAGLGQLGVEAALIQGELFSPGSLAQMIQLYKSLAETPPAERPRVLTAARGILAALGDSFKRSSPNSPAPLTPPSRQGAGSSGRPEFFGGGRLWLEARDHREALMLSRGWREPLLISLTPRNYAAFLQDHRRWSPRRLIWRLPPAIRESALAFYQKALETLRQGGYNRFVAGDWGAVALAGGAGGLVYGDQTLGARNSWSLQAARGLGVTKVCLPPGSQPEHWQALLKKAPSGSFWSYLYQVVPLAVYPGEAAALAPLADLRWLPQDDYALLCSPTAWSLRGLKNWFKQQNISPLVVALTQTSLSWGKTPSWLGTRPQGHTKAK
jgi:collagenase-like PrtC family protease